MTLEQYLWRHHDDEMVDLVMAVLTTRFRPSALTEWWSAMSAEQRPLSAMRDGEISASTLVDLVVESRTVTRAHWPESVKIAADALRQAANEARERGAA